MIITFCAIVFWVSAGIVAYAYAGYPFLIHALSRVFPKPVAKSSYRGTYSVVIAAHNEAPRLAAKVAGLVAQTSAAGMTQLLIGSDGSTDGTADMEKELRNILRARHMDPARLQLVHFAARRGKPAVLNDLIGRCTAEIIVLTDARQEIDSRAVDALLQNLSDECVGAVSGELVFRRGENDSTDARGAGAYWAYEKWIRKSESAFGSVPGATGALYAIRREHVAKIPEDTLLDDVLIPMQLVAKGMRCVFEERATVFDTPSQSASQEALRKRRTLAGNVQLFIRHPRWLLPGGSAIWWQYASHKFLRVVCPFLLPLAFFANLALWRLETNPIYEWLWALQILFYGAAFIGILLGQRGGASVFFRIPALFVMMNVTAAQGVWDAISRKTNVTWAKSDGPSPP